MKIRVMLTICAALIMVATMALSGAAPAYACGGSMDHGSMGQGGMGQGQMGYGQTAQSHMGYGPASLGGGPVYAPAPPGNWTPGPAVPQGRQQTAPAPAAPGSAQDHQH